MSILVLLVLAGCSEELKVREIVPKIGVTSGGEPVEIIGSGFHTGMGISVYLGSKKADNVAINGKNKLTFSTPASPTGPSTVDVLIRFDNGEEFRMEQAFTYVEPSSAGMDIRQLGSRQSQRQKN
jgi:hypothetical protein